MRGADRVTVAALAEDLGAFVPIDGVVARQKDGAFRYEMVEDPSGQAARSRQEDQRRCEKMRW